MVFTIPKNKSQENSWDDYHLDCSFKYLSIVNAIVRNPQAKKAKGMMRIVAIRYIHFIVVT